MYACAFYKIQFYLRHQLTVNRKGLLTNKVVIKIHVRSSFGQQLLISENMKKFSICWGNGLQEIIPSGIIVKKLHNLMKNVKIAAGLVSHSYRRLIKICKPHTDFGGDMCKYLKISNIT